MRAVFLAFVTSILVFLAGLNSVSAKDYLYCIQGDDFAGGAGECIFATRAQCQATVSGRTGSCTENRNFSANALLVDKSRARHHQN
jgi:uncharacterized protein DUF3551